MLSCYEENVDKMVSKLMETTEDDDFKAALIALCSIVGDLKYEIEELKNTLHSDKPKRKDR